MAARFYPTAQLLFASTPKGGYDLLAGQRPPAPRRHLVRLLKSLETPPPAVIDLLGSDDPLTIDSAADGDERFTGVITQTATLNLIAQSHWNHEDFLPRTDREIQLWVDEVITTTTGTTYAPKFRGWLMPVAAAVDYSAKPFSVTLTAACGLTTLKTRVVLDLEQKYPVAVRSFRDVLEGILAQTGYELPLSSLMNLTPIGDRLTPSGKDPLGNLYYRPEAFRTEPDGDKPLSARQALDSLCAMLGANLTQWNGRWWLVRTAEMAGGWLPPGNNGTGANRKAFLRHYGAPGSTTPPTTEAIDLAVPMGPGYPLRMEYAARDENQFALPALRVDQKYSPPKTLITNGDFAAVGSDGLPVGWFKQNPGHPWISRVGTGTPADPFAVQIIGSGDNYIPLNEANLVSLNTSVDWPAGTQKRPAFRLKGQFSLKNNRAAKLVVIMALSGRMYVNRGVTWQLLNEDGTWLADPPKNERYGIEIENITKTGGTIATKEGWADFDILLNAYDLPLQGPGNGTTILAYEVKLCRGVRLNDNADPNNPNAWVRYRNITLQLEAENPYTGRKYIVKHWDTAPAEVLAPPVEPAITIYYGDASLATLGETTTQLLTKDASGNLTYAYGFDKPDVPNVAGTGAPLALWAARERAAQVAAAAHRVDGTLHGELPMGPISLVQLMDSEFQPRMLPVRWHWSLAQARWDLSLLELLLTPKGTLTGAYLTETGEVPFTPESVAGLDVSDREVPTVPRKGGAIIPSFEVKPPRIYQLDNLPGSSIVLSPTERRQERQLEILSPSGAILSRAFALARALTNKP